MSGRLLSGVAAPNGTLFGRELCSERVPSLRDASGPPSLRTRGNMVAVGEAI
ncbi:MAG: hypothetical protein LBT00_10915 [Spirochaetaceae bacterium]|nr:hypothetical protein [Spirochaetaceae bacterium]